jgi:signal transduction histidine kinase
VKETNKILPLKKYILPIAITVLGICSLYSQKKSTCDQWDKEFAQIIDSDKQLKFCEKYLSKVDDACKVDILKNMAEIYSNNTKQDSAFYYFDKAILLAQKINKNEYLGDVYARKASFIRDLGKIDDAKLLLKKAHLLLKKFPNHKKKVGYYTAMAFMSDSEGDFQKAIKYCDSNISLAKINKLPNVIPDNYHNKGYYFYNLSEYEKAAQNLLKAAELKEKEKESDIGNTFYMLGSCYEMWGQKETAVKYLEKAIYHSNLQKNYNTSLRCHIRISKLQRGLNNFNKAKIAVDSAIYLGKKMKFDGQYAEAVTEKGWLYLQSFKDTITAEKLYLQGHQLALKSKDDGTIFFNLQSLLMLYYAKKDFQKATPYMKIFGESADECNTLMHTREKDNFFRKYYAGIGDYKKAYDHFQSYALIDDSINKTSTKTEVADLEKKYDTQGKELKITNLNKEKEKAEFKQNLFLISAIFLLLILGIGFWLYKKIQYQKNALTKAHNELGKNNEKLQELDTVKNRLFSIIAHDLRSMLIPFQRSGKLLKYFIDNKQESQAITLSNELEKNSNSLSNMLDNLLNWSLDQMNGYQSNPTVISIKNELEEIMIVYQQQAHYKNTELALQYKEDESIWFDKGAFHVIFRNLIGNALKYTENGKIKVSFEREFNILKCFVEDTGIGMSKEQIDELFTLKENKTTIGTQGEKGTGIGLNLVYRFININQGTIIITSEKRIGTQFEISFPIKEVKEVDNTKSQSA